MLFRLLSLFLFASAALRVPAEVSDQSSEKPAGKAGTYSQVHVDQPYVAMTFDDGPSAENTPRLLEMLKERNIKATFFLIGQNAAANPNVVRQILADGHEIGNHSWTHPQLSKLSDERVKGEISKTQEAIKDACGFVPTLLRPPYGAITAHQKQWIEDQLGLNVILWSVDPLDWKRPGAAVITHRILSGVAPGAIVLSHDIHKQTVDAMPATLDALTQRGYKFVTVSQLIALKKPAAPPAAAKATSGESEDVLGSSPKQSGGTSSEASESSKK